jgi:hypothetical protein
VWEAVRGGRVVETLAVVQEAIRAAEPLLGLEGAFKGRYGLGMK